MAPGQVIANHVHLTKVVRALSGGREPAARTSTASRSASAATSAARTWTCASLEGRLLIDSAAFVTDDSRIFTGTTDLAKYYAEKLEGLGTAPGDPDKRPAPWHRAAAWAGPDGPGNGNRPPEAGPTRPGQVKLAVALASEGGGGARGRPHRLGHDRPRVPGPSVFRHVGGSAGAGAGTFSRLDRVPSAAAKPSGGVGRASVRVPPNADTCDAPAGSPVPGRHLDRGRRGWQDARRPEVHP
jgi:hypothetical protein